MLTMMMSIAHRITGAGLAVGFALLTWWLVAVSMGPEAYNHVQSFFGSFIGRALLFAFTWALIHHMLGGLRHFVWDMGAGFELATANLMARATIIGSIALTILIWVVGYMVR